MTIRFTSCWHRRRGSSFCCVTTALVLALACRDEYTVDVGTGGAGGAGGSSGSEGAAAGASGSSAAAGAAGTAGAAGSPNEPPDGGTVHFRALLQGETIIFEVSQNAWHITCTDTPRVLQKLGDTWTPLRDERPTVTNDALAAHYLDGVYESACLEDSGCHVNACSAIAYDERLSNGIDDVLRLSAREYVQVGERQALTCSALDAGVESDAGAGADAGLRVVPEIERRAPTGPLIVRVLYFLDSACNTAPLTADVVVE